MSAYLKFYELEQSPFESESQTQVVLGTRALRDAFAAIRTGLEEDASRICVTGKRGLGKTSLSRALPKLLGESTRVALVIDPTLSWESARGSVARQWGLEKAGLARARLIEAARAKRLVLVIDQAEKASEEFLAHLDVVLSYRSEDDRPVVQSVLLACLDASPGEEPAPLLWWLDRIQTLQLEFAPLPRDGVASYIERHLKRAGWRGQSLFSEDAIHAIHGFTSGVPGEVSALCERLLDEAAKRGLSEIDAAFVNGVCDDGAGEPEEELWTLEDELDELDEIALEDEYEGPGEEILQPTSTVREDVAAAFATSIPDRSDDTASSNEDPLDAPPTEAELRAIRGSGLGRMLRNFLVAAIAAIVGGIAFAQLMREPEATSSDLSDSLTRTTQTHLRTQAEQNAANGQDRARSLIQPGGGFVSPDVLERLGDRVPGASGSDPGSEANR